jgi:predicted lactoylglutathione lyase
MPHFPDHPTLEIVLYSAAAVVILFIGYKVGRAFGALATNKLIDKKEQELFTTQKGFKTLYEQEIAKLKEENAAHILKAQTLEARVEDYRKKAAGLGGLFHSGGKKADAMYALLLENEALEEALMSQNEKLNQERTDALKEQMRNTSYRRVLMSQLLNDERIKSYVAEVLADEKRLPSPETQTAAGGGAAAGTTPSSGTANGEPR